MVQKNDIVILLFCVFVSWEYLLKMNWERIAKSECEPHIDFAGYYPIPLHRNDTILHGPAMDESTCSPRALPIDGLMF